MKNSSRTFRIPTIGVIFFLILAIPSIALAAFFKLSGMMPAFGDVVDFQTEPNGRYAIYHANQNTAGAVELYSTPLDGQITPTRLNGLLPSNSSVGKATISTSGLWVVYIAPQDTSGVNELYAVPITGPASAGIKLNDALPTNQSVIDFQISADNSTVVYLADQDSDDVFELYSVPITGPASAGIQLNEMLDFNGDVIDFQISPDNDRVIYRANQDDDNVIELYSVPINGPASDGLKLNPNLVPGGDIADFTISPDSSRVVYRASQDTVQTVELYSVPINGPADNGIRLNQTLANDGDVEEFEISADSNHVVYRSDMQTETIFELYSVPLTGPASSNVKLNGALVTNGKVRAFQLAPAGDRVVYLADQQTLDIIELYSIPISGPANAAVKLNGNLLDNDGHIDAFAISANSQQVVYLADQVTDQVFELYSAPISGNEEAIQLNPSLGIDRDVTAFAISPDSRSAVYLADSDINEVIELYQVAISGGGSTKLNQDLDPGRNVTDFEIAANSGRVVYLADQVTDDIFELFIADNGQPTVNFTATEITIEEGIGQAPLTVTLSSSTIYPVTVTYLISDIGPVTGIDATVFPGPLTFAPGETSQAIDVTVQNNFDFEENKIILLTLNTVQNGVIGPTAVMTLTIRNDDFYLFLPVIMRD